MEWGDGMGYPIFKPNFGGSVNDEKNVGMNTTIYRQKLASSRGKNPPNKMFSVMIQPTTPAGLVNLGVSCRSSRRHSQCKLPKPM